MKVNEERVERLASHIQNLIEDTLDGEYVDEVAKALTVLAYTAVTHGGEDMDEMQRLRLIVELQTYSLECGKQGLEELRQRNRLRHDEVEGRA